MPSLDADLRQACSSGDVQKVSDLLSMGANPNDEDPKSGHTALHTAARAGKDEVVILLRKNKAEVLATDKDGATPLLLAVRGGHLACVEALTRGKASMSTVDHPDDSGRTPAWWAAFRGDGKIFELLMARGADISLRDVTKRRPIDVAIHADHFECACLARLTEREVAELKQKDMAAQLAAEHERRVKRAEKLGIAPPPEPKLKPSNVAGARPRRLTDPNSPSNKQRRTTRDLDNGLVSAKPRRSTEPVEELDGYETDDSGVVVMGEPVQSPPKALSGPASVSGWRSGHTSAATSAANSGAAPRRVEKLRTAEPDAGAQQKPSAQESPAKGNPLDSPMSLSAQPRAARASGDRPARRSTESGTDSPTKPNPLSRVSTAGKLLVRPLTGVMRGPRNSGGAASMSESDEPSPSPTGTGLPPSGGGRWTIRPRLPKPGIRLPQLA